MSAPFPRSSSRAKIPIRVPCRFPGCNRWFGNKAGLTQHVNRFHPTVTTIGPRPIPEQPECHEADEPNGSELYPPHTGVDSEGVDSVDSQWHGPGAKLYRNYHTELTGKFSRFISSCRVLINV